MQLATVATFKVRGDIRVAPAKFVFCRASTRLFVVGSQNDNVMISAISLPQRITSIAVTNAD